MANETIKGLKDFYTTISSNGLRVQHQFAIEFGGSGIPADISNLVPIYATGATLPGRKTEVQPTPFYGFPFQIPVNLSYTQTWNCTVRSDINMAVRKAFEEWFNKYADLSKNTGGMKGVVPTGDYALIHLLSASYFNSGISQGATAGQVSRTYRLEGIFPSDIGDMPQSHSSNAIAEFPMTFTFQYWYPVDASDPLA